mgnify:CR=1 FL=1
MKLVVLDIGGTSIKYAKYEDGILKEFFGTFDRCKKRWGICGTECCRDYPIIKTV